MTQQTPQRPCMNQFEDPLGEGFAMIHKKRIFWERRAQRNWSLKWGFLLEDNVKLCKNINKIISENDGFVRDTYYKTNPGRLNDCYNNETNHGKQCKFISTPTSFEYGAGNPIEMGPSYPRVAYFMK